MSGRITALIGVIVLMALAGLDYGAAANGRTEGQPLGVIDHAMTRIDQARTAIGLAPPPAAPPTTSVGQAMAAIQSALAEAQARPEAAAGADLAAAAAAGDAAAMGRAAEAEFARAAAALDDAAPATGTKHNRPARKGQITVGIGNCTMGGAGKFCSLGD